jgi:antitoxin (DNA-binding transcriptional repressor) of toxin-antitoxin stability system
MGCMSRQVNLYEAKTHLSRLIEQAANGEVIVIAKDGKPMAQLGPLAVAGAEPRKLGQLSELAKGIDWVQWWHNWKAADAQIEADFEAAAAKPFPTGRQKKRRPRRHS